MTDTPGMSNKSDTENENPTTQEWESDGWALQVLDEPAFALEPEHVRAIALLGIESDRRGDPSDGDSDFAVLHAPEGTPTLVMHTVAHGIVEILRRAVAETENAVAESD